MKDHPLYGNVEGYVFVSEDGKNDLYRPARTGQDGGRSSLGAKHSGEPDAAVTSSSARAPPPSTPSDDTTHPAQGEGRNDQQREVRRRPDRLSKGYRAGMEIVDVPEEARKRADDLLSNKHWPPMGTQPIVTGPFPVTPAATRRAGRHDSRECHGG